MPRQNSKCGDEGARQYEDARIRSSPPRNECRRRTSVLLVTALLVAVFSIALYQLFHKMRTETALPLLFAASIANVGVASAFNNPPGVDIWCGKAYRPTNASFNPGGWLEEPPRSPSPLLDLRIYPRMNLYTADDQYGSFIIDAGLSYTNGLPWHNSSFPSEDMNQPLPSTTLYVDISITDSGHDLVSGGNVSIGSTSNEFVFSLSSVAPRYASYDITLEGASADGNQSFTVTTQLYVLPKRSHPGSVTKLDNLYGGLQVQNYLTNSLEWAPLLPYSYYVSWGGWLENSIDNLNLFQSYGYNIIHIVPTYDYDEFELFFDRCDQLGLWVMYDMRHTYQNTSAVTEQVNRFKNHNSLLLWYTGDEPDGSGDPLNATRLSYDLIKSLDPYHPVSLCLNCYNFYYGDYSSGADIILSDVYPIAVNTSYSNVYGTVCNTTYGCCGCDDCNGDFEDISTRLDLFTQYESWLGRAPKALWGVPQGFGASQFWERYPTADEEVVMGMLSINHNAKGIVAWDFPTEPDINNATSALAKVLTAPEITAFILGAPTVALKVLGDNRLDVASWTIRNQMLISIVSLEYPESSDTVSISLPPNAKTVGRVAWGNTGWSLEDGNLVKDGLESLEVDILILDLE